MLAAPSERAGGWSQSRAHGRPRAAFERLNAYPGGSTLWLPLVQSCRGIKKFARKLPSWSLWIVLLLTFFLGIMCFNIQLSTKHTTRSSWSVFYNSQQYHADMDTSGLSQQAAAPKVYITEIDERGPEVVILEAATRPEALKTVNEEGSEAQEMAVEAPLRRSVPNLTRVPEVKMQKIPEEAMHILDEQAEDDITEKIVDRVEFVNKTAPLDVWPRPQRTSFLCVPKPCGASATVSPALTFNGDISSKFVHIATVRYRKLMFPHEASEAGSIQNVYVNISRQGGEDYSLRVSPDGVEIEARAPVGVQYALETFSQLVSFDFDRGVYVTQPVLPLLIEDSPRYGHRGLLVDSSRHFLPVLVLKKVITSMSYAKLNILHWHITDAQSFPIESRVEPALARMASWSSRERYTKQDVKEVVEHAANHGIEVVPEFDMPGHSASWGKARPDLMTSTDDHLKDGNTAALNPVGKETFQFIESLLQDWLVGHRGHEAFFNTTLIHLGSDEVPFKAWKELGDPKTLLRSFLHHVAGMAKKLDKDFIFWEDAFRDSAAPEQAIIQVWRDDSAVPKITAAGHRMLMSQGWYLDHLDQKWPGMYDRDPSNFVSDSKTHLVLGGEGCMWGETVDGGNIEQTIWPRLAAIAERLWSPAGGTVSSARPRLSSFRCLLLERGVASGALDGYGRSAPRGPGSCR